MGNLEERILAINSQIELLKNEIHEDYMYFSGLQEFSDRQSSQHRLDELVSKKNALLNRISEVSNRNSILLEELKYVDDLRDYYENNLVDSLFLSSDLASLHLHKAVIGDDYPKVMDDLEMILECRELFDKEYNPSSNEECLNRIESLPSCQATDRVKDLLIVHKDVTNEVASWIRQSGHSLLEMVRFQKRLEDFYGVSLDSDYPYLADAVRRVVQLGR